MPKTPKDWVGMIIKGWTLISVLGSAFTHIESIEWLSNGKNVWLLMLGLSLFFLALWAIERYIQREIVTPIREATAALSRMEEAAKSLTVAVGSQCNSVEALKGTIQGTYEHIRISLKELLARIPPPPKTGA